MSGKIPFLEMFSLLQRRGDLAEAVESWQITVAEINKAALSIYVEVEGAAGAGANLLRDAEEGICRAYGLKSARIQALLPVKQETTPKPEKAPAPAPAVISAPKEEKKTPVDPFSRTEALRQAAIQRSGVAPAAPKTEKKSGGDVIFGKAIGKPPVDIGELELDMGMVVIEGDVFAVDNKELKKRGAWVVAFDVTDYTGSIRVMKFFPGDEGKPLVDKIKKGMRLKIQGRLNIDRFYGDMVLEPVAVTTATPRP